MRERGASSQCRQTAAPPLDEPFGQMAAAGIGGKKADSGTATPPAAMRARATVHRYGLPAVADLEMAELRSEGHGQGMGGEVVAQYAQGLVVGRQPRRVVLTRSR